MKKKTMYLKNIFLKRFLFVCFYLCVCVCVCVWILKNIASFGKIHGDLRKAITKWKKDLRMQKSPRKFKAKRRNRTSQWQGNG